MRESKLRTTPLNLKAIIMTKDYSIKMQDGAGRETTLSINGASVDEMIADGYSTEEARESLESNQFQKAIADGKIGADAWASLSETQRDHITYKVRTVEEFEALHLSFYTLSCLARATSYVYPHKALPAAIEGGLYKGQLTLDRLGNFVSFL